MARRRLRHRLRRPSEAVRRVAAAVPRGAEPPALARPTAAGVRVREMDGGARCGERRIR